MKPRNNSIIPSVNHEKEVIRNKNKNMNINLKNSEI